jgi:hypothetical protein
MCAHCHSSGRTARTITIDQFSEVPGLGQNGGHRGLALRGGNWALKLTNSKVLSKDQKLLGKRG